MTTWGEIGDLLDAVCTVAGIQPRNRHLFTIGDVDRAKKAVPRDSRLVPHAEAFKRWPHSKSVCERLVRLNPKGFEEGSIPRGWHPKPRVDRFINDYITPQDVIRRDGIDVYRAIPATAWSHKGCKKYMTRLDYMKIRPAHN